MSGTSAAEYRREGETQPPSVAMLPLDGAAAAVPVRDEEAVGLQEIAVTVEAADVVADALNDLVHGPPEPGGRFIPEAARELGDLELAVRRHETRALAARAGPAESGLDERDRGSRSPVQERPRHLQPRDSASDDGEVRAETALERGERRRAAAVPEDGSGAFGFGQRRRR